MSANILRYCLYHEVQRSVCKKMRFVSSYQICVLFTFHYGFFGVNLCYNGLKMQAQHVMWVNSVNISRNEFLDFLYFAKGLHVFFQCPYVWGFLRFPGVYRDNAIMCIFYTGNFLYRLSYVSYIADIIFSLDCECIILTFFNLFSLRRLKTLLPVYFIHS